MRTPRRNQRPDATAQPHTAARGRRAHAGPPADEPPVPTPEPRARRAEESERPEETAPAGPGTLPRRRGLRPRTVRAKIVSLLMVPVVSLLALWGFATVTTAQDVARLRQLQRVDTDVRRPVAAAVTALQDERGAAVRQAVAPAAARAAELKERMRDTDAAVDRLRLDDRHTIGDTGDLPREVADRIGSFVTTVGRLSRLRAAAAGGGGADGKQVYEEYTAAVTSAFAIEGALTGVQEAQPGTDARVLLEFARAGEMLSREDALLGAAQLSGQLNAERLQHFIGVVETRRTLAASAGADLRASDRAAWRKLADSHAYGRLTAAEDRVRAAAPGRKAAQASPSAAWDDAHDAVREELLAIEDEAHRAAADRADPFGGGALSPGGAAVLLGLAAVAASLVISVRIGRGLVVELISLRNTALGIARRKLPAAMRRLRAGEEIDVRAETPPGPAPQDEIGQVGEALVTVHRAALSAAVERAELASGISGVFVNLARRSQVLVHRQLNLLDSMERRADDPNELGDLFRLDHLTTRMRRHAESLIILSGAAPGRAWRMPVPLTNVVRAAVSEIEDYARVEVRRLPEAAVVGGAVADLTHLLAELVENAAQFSPPHTKVRISGEPVGNGYALEIEDRGLGMGKETLAEANTRIRQSEALDLFDSDRLGLFVVSRLSSRHDIKVHLRTSPYGGTTAVVLLPTELLQGALPPGRGRHHATTVTVDDRDPVEGTAPRQSGAAAVGPGPAQAPAPAQPLPRPPRIPALAAPPEEQRPGPADGTTAGVTSLRLRGRSGPPPASAPGPAPDPGSGQGPRPAPTSGPGKGPGGEPGTDSGKGAGADPGTREDRSGRGTATPPAPVLAQLSRPTRTATPPPPVPPPAKPLSPVASTDDGSDLPRRVRQAHLVPQLREAPPADPAPTAVSQGADERTPEQVRDRMTAYRDGWTRGGGAAPGSRRPLGTGFGNEGEHA
ncbi:nitrate- and nitrite sensing domain-containing protein [Streptomyces sp. NPDC085614]|uniref:sensor histidine kinase n=1 Tax=Streptomyces sp. NPDC085614 TaxID=3365733 RepID=UPI0037D1D3F8